MTAALIVFLVLLFTGLPLYVDLGLSSFLYIFITGMKPIVVLQRITQAANSFTMIAAPFFILMGNLMNTGGVTRKLFRFANTLVGSVPGGMGHANILCSAMFAGMSGTAVADAGGLGNIEIEAMRDLGYDDDFSCAVTAASSVLGPIIPPSLPMVILAVTVGASIGRCFVGGIIPGVLMAVAMGCLVTYYSHKRHYPRNPKPTAKIIWVAFKEAIWALLSPIILFVSIYTGIVTTTEAAIIAALYSMIVGLYAYKDLRWRDIPQIMLATCETTGVVLAIVMTANIFGYSLSVAQIPQKISLVLTSISNKFLFLIVINLFLLFVGCFMEGGNPDSRPDSDPGDGGDGRFGDAGLSDHDSEPDDRRCDASGRGGALRHIQCGQGILQQGYPGDDALPAPAVYCADDRHLCALRDQLAAESGIRHPVAHLQYSALGL